MTRSGRTRRATHQPGRRFSTMRRRGDKHVMIAVFLSYLVFGLMIFAGLRHFQTTNDARQDRISQENDKARDKFSLDQCLRQRNLEREHNRLIDATNRGWLREAQAWRRIATATVNLEVRSLAATSRAGGHGAPRDNWQGQAVTLQMTPVTRSWS